MRADTDASSARRLDPVASKPTRHALTIDVEDWFHDDWRPERGVDWDRLPSTVCAAHSIACHLPRPSRRSSFARRCTIAG